MKKILFLFFIFLLTSNLAFANENNENKEKKEEASFIDAKQLEVSDLLAEATSLYHAIMEEEDLVKQEEVLKNILAMYEKIIKIDDKNDLAYVGLGNVYNDLAVIKTVKLNNEKEVIEYFEKAILYYEKAKDIKPQNPDVMYMMGFMEYKISKQQKEKQEEIKNLEKALNHFESSNFILAQDYVGIAIIQTKYLLARLEDDLIKKQNYIDSGIKTFNNYFTEQTNNFLALINVALLYDLKAHLETDLIIKKVSFDKAIQFFDKQITSGGNIGFSYYERAQTLRTIANLETDKKRKLELLENALSSIKFATDLNTKNSSYKSLAALLSCEKSLLVEKEQDILIKYAETNWEESENSLKGSSLYERALWAAENKKYDESKKMLQEIKKIENETGAKDLLRAYDYVKNEKAFEIFYKEQWFIDIWN